MSRSRSTTSKRLGEIIGGVTSLVRNMSVATRVRRSRDTTYEATKRVLQSTTSSIANAGLKLVDILLVGSRNLLDVALGQVACFVLAHGAEGFFFELALEPWRDAEPDSHVSLQIMGSLTGIDSHVDAASYDGEEHEDDHEDSHGLVCVGFFAVVVVGCG